jgi:hypothetical protein
MFIGLPRGSLKLSNFSFPDRSRMDNLSKAHI